MGWRHSHTLFRQYCFGGSFPCSGSAEQALIDQTVAVVVHRDMLYPELAAELSGVHMVLIWQSYTMQYWPGNESLCQDSRKSVNEDRQCVAEKDAHRS